MTSSRRGPRNVKKLEGGDSRTVFTSFSRLIISHKLHVRYLSMIDLLYQIFNIINKSRIIYLRKTSQTMYQCLIHSTYFLLPYFRIFFGVCNHHTYSMCTWIKILWFNHTVETLRQFLSNQCSFWTIYNTLSLIEEPQYCRFLRKTTKLFESSLGLSF